MSAIRGSCLCRGVGYRVEGPLDPLLHCHCSMCRKAHGAAFGSYGAAPEPAFAWERGRELVARYESSPGFFRCFCSRCGSVLPNPDPNQGKIQIPVGTLDDDPGSRPEQHIFVGSKAPWHEIADRLRQHDRYPGFDGYLGPKPITPARAGVVRGSCLCGRVAYEIDGPVELIQNCHCSRCRKARAAAHASNGFAESGRFRWCRGEGQLERFKVPDAERFTSCFCGVCGSPMPVVRSDLAVLPAGSFDDDPGGCERFHIFVAAKAPWYEIADALPQFDEYVPGDS